MWCRLVDRIFHYPASIPVVVLMCVYVPAQMLMGKAIGTIHKVCVSLRTRCIFVSLMLLLKKNLHYVTLFLVMQQNGLKGNP